MGLKGSDDSPDTGSVTFRTSQFDQCLKKFSGMSSTSSSVLSETDDKLEHIFGGMETCFNASLGPNIWIVDSGASNHMTTNVDVMQNSVVVDGVPSINLPNGDVSKISRIGGITFANGLLLKSVLGVPAFTYNLL
uniref:Retrovirus-related Pol polyprotein from transposon TNT 1-94-like beta-barrel domain-containing protein n=1 Tax=Chenopodium quinoa TaxID=63459 RepID=A0A803MD35_CHEQI